MVFYPSNTTWASAPVGIYTRPGVGKPGVEADAMRIEQQVAQVVAMYRSAGETLTATRVQSLTSRAGAKGELWSFSGYRNGGTEFAAYFPARQTVNYFVLQLPNGEALAPAEGALLELANSYREGNDYKPCTGTSQCSGTN